MDGINLNEETAKKPKNAILLSKEFLLYVKTKIKKQKQKAITVSTEILGKFWSVKYFFSDLA